MAAGPWWGLDLVTIEPGEEPDPPLMENAQVPVGQRFCAKLTCREEVGRGKLDEGHCTVCGTRFSFVPGLRPGDEVSNGQYRVTGVLGRGGFGWAYLAHDTHLERKVVLKVLINDQVADTVQRERKHLTELEHRYIVQIRDYVSDGRYLVLDFAGGRPVRPVGLEEPIELVLAFGLQLLEALDYLHGKGFLHCDVKPDNIIRGSDRVRLIDFGAVRKIGDPGQVVELTEHYSPLVSDPERARPTVGFDLYCAARTLEELCRQHLNHRREMPGIQSLRLLIDRATDTVSERRFVSARQFAEQLSGVIRQVAAARDGRTVPHRSMVFGSMAQALDGGLGAVMPVDVWAAALPGGGDGLRTGEPYECPTPGQVAGALPAVLADPWGVVGGAAVQAQLSACHAALGQGSPAEAATALAGAGLSADDWRAAWYRGRMALAAEDVKPKDVEMAVQAFTTVRTAVPGELVPMLALGLCAEIERDPTLATMRYGMASSTDDSLIAAHFGLARTLLAGRHRPAAATALDRIPRESRFEREARIAGVRSLTAVFPAGEGTPTLDQVTQAENLAKALDLDPLTTALLDIEIAHAVAVCQRESAVRSDAAWLRLERALRRVAMFATTQHQHAALIDLANVVRPVTVWSY